MLFFPLVGLPGSQGRAFAQGGATRHLLRVPE
jgi:hypothetical protein